MRPLVTATTLALTLVTPVRCAEDAEAPRVSLPVVVDGSLVTPCTNDLGYDVEVTALRLVVADVGFTVEGETHGAAVPDPRERLLRALAAPGQAHAHPGHYAGGEVTGELPGVHVLDWIGDDGAALGDATLLPGAYHGANLGLKVGAVADGLQAGDALVGHGAYLAGRATRDGRTVTFEARLELPDPAMIVGAPLDLDVTAGTRATLGLAFAPIDPYEHDTVFDGLDFFALDDAQGGEGPVLMGAGGTAHNLLRRAFFTHDHFFVTTLEP